MSGRTGPPFKLVLYGLFFIGFVYVLYIYHATNGKLRDAENLAERYRREEETKVTQLQDLMKSKEELQEKCDSDRQDFVSRLSSLNQQHKMLKGRNEEMEADYGRLQQELQKLKEDQEHLESQRSQEFQQLKQEKELEIASYKDQVANYQRQNEQLQNEISSLKAQLQNSQTQLQYDQNVVSSLEQEVTRLKTDLQQEKTTAVHLNSSIKTLQIQLGESQSVSKDLERNLTESQIQLRESQTVSKNLERNITESQKHIVEDQSLITTLKQELSNLKQFQQNVYAHSNMIPAFHTLQNQAALQGQANGVQQPGVQQQAIQQQAIQQQANVQQPGVQQQVAQQQVAQSQLLNPDGNRQAQQLPVEQQQQNVQQPDNQDNPAQQNQANAADAGKVEQGGAANEVVEHHQIQPPNDAEAAGQGKEQEFGALNNKLVEQHGQIFKPDFKQNEDILNQKEQMADINNMNNIDLDHHDNRMEHEGPVNLQVQEPKLLGDKQEEQAMQQMAPANALVANMAQFQHQGQMEIPNVGLGEKEENKLVNRKGVRIDREDGDQQYNDDNYDNKYDQDKDDANAGEDEEEEERGHFN
ncbi:putative mediator of RNA polymerase II transcription subunit 26 isoform X2 [Patella vulgata]|uniref:putative mediator of RNA polymerase II transcription subunit 26 isoform X2 n=1 Tax=Patella vulgata TaxID=6465 RepID=UPI00217F78E5|nr:putative mediator of RNA polymerase II transcription subunit 26 isoform X2 [Patella vulgata]